MLLAVFIFISLIYKDQGYIVTQETCDWDLFYCQYDNSYPLPYTHMFKCNHHLNCPENFKCCKHRCFRHKICQPYQNRPAKILTPINHQVEVEEKSGICDVKISCNTFYPESLTRHFECFSDYACPYKYKCCYIDCWRHRVCQPIKEVLNNQVTNVQSTDDNEIATTEIVNGIFKSTSPYIAASENTTVQYEQTNDLFSRPTETNLNTTEQQYATVKTMESPIANISYNTIFHSSTISNTNAMENIANYTTVSYITEVQKNVLSSIIPHDENNNNTNEKAITNMNIFQTTYNINDKTNEESNNHTTILYNSSIIEIDSENVTFGISGGKPSTEYNTSTSRIVTKTTDFPYITVVKPMMSSITPNHNNDNNQTNDTPDIYIDSYTTFPSNNSINKEELPKNTFPNNIFSSTGTTQQDGNFTDYKLRTTTNEIDSKHWNSLFTTENVMTISDTTQETSLTEDSIDVDSDDKDFDYSGDGITNKETTENLMIADDDLYIDENGSTKGEDLLNFN